MTNPMIPPGVNPDDVEIKVLTPQDFAGVIWFTRDGEVEIKIDGDAIPPAVLVKLLTDLAVQIMVQENLTKEDVVNAPVYLFGVPPEETP